MSDPLGRRCTLVLLLAMGIALGTGLLAWGPVPLDPVALPPSRHRAPAFAQVADLLVQLPLFLVACWGLRVTRDSAWPDELRRLWTAFHALLGVAALAGALHAAQPGVASGLAARAALCGAFLALGAGALTERLHVRAGGPAALFQIGVALLLALGAVGFSDPRDLRPLLLLEAAPLLLVLAGVPSLGGAHTRRVDWLLMLGLWAAARAAVLFDPAVRAATGGIAGQTLAVLFATAAAARLAYAAAARPATAPTDGDNQRSTSLNTAG